MLGGNLGSLLYGDVSVMGSYSVNRMLSLYYVYLTLISNFDFGDRILVLFLLVPGHCLLCTFVNSKLSLFNDFSFIHLNKYYIFTGV